MNNANTNDNASTNNAAATGPISLTLMETRLSPLPGYPNVLYFDSKTDTIVGIALTPLIGIAPPHDTLDNKPTLDYIFTVSNSRGGLNRERVAKLIEAALGEIDLEGVQAYAQVRRNSEGKKALGVHIFSEDCSGEEAPDGSGKHPDASFFRAIVSIEVEQKIVDENMDIMQKGIEVSSKKKMISGWINDLVNKPLH